MPLTDFVRYLNAQHPVFFAGDELSPAFVMEDGKVLARYAGLSLSSIFHPIDDVREESLWGHVAGLAVTRLKTGVPVNEDVLFSMPNSDQEFVYLDRLVRTLHSLNYLTYRNWRQRGTLLLTVHPRHVASVASDHGLAFEGILKSCGLMPAQVALSFSLNAADNREHFVKAFENYRGRGYGIVLEQTDPSVIDRRLLEAIGPEIVVLPPDSRWSEDNVDELHLCGARVMAGGNDSSAQRALASRIGIDLYQRRPRQHKLIHGDVQHSLANPYGACASTGFA